MDDAPATPTSPARRLLAVLGPLLLYSVAAALYLRPLWQGWGERILGRGGDPLFNLYVLKWSAHQIRLGLPDLWNANILFPARGALAFSDHLLGPALALLLLLDLRLVPNAIAGYNLLLASSFVLSAAATCWVLRGSGRSWPAALLGGGMYAFAPMRWAHLEHIQVLLAQWIPVTLWCADRLLARPTWKRGGAFLACYLLNLAGGSYLAYMIHLPLLAVGVSRAAAAGRELLSWRRLRILLSVAAPAAAAAWLLYHPYVETARRYGLERSPAEVALYSATLASYLAPSEANLYAGWWHRLVDRWQIDLSLDESRLFPGFAATLLFLYGAAAFLRRYHLPPVRRLPLWQRSALAALLAGAALAFLAGDVQTLSDDVPVNAWKLPALACGGCLGLWLLLRRRWGGGGVLRLSAMDPWERGVALGGLATFLLSFPIVFVPLMGIVPGLANLRAPGRFNALTGFAVIFFAAKGLDGALQAAAVPAMAAPGGRRRWPGGRRGWAAAALAALAGLVAVELAPAASAVASRPLRDEPQFPAVYRYLAAPGPPRALLELPRLRPPRESLYMYYSTLHWRPIANGYSGFLPASDDELRQRIPVLPDGDGFALLRQYGISDLVIHAAGPDSRELREQLPGWERQFLGREVELSFAAEADRVYRLRGVSTEGWPPPLVAVRQRLAIAMPPPATASLPARGRPADRR